MAAKPDNAATGRYGAVMGGNRLDCVLASHYSISGSPDNDAVSLPDDINLTVEIRALDRNKRSGTWEREMEHHVQPLRP